jgi:hypothetical protein
MKSFYKAGTASYAGSGILKLSIIVVCVLAVAAIGIAALVLPKYTVTPEKVDKTVEAIVVQNNGLISIDADLSGVYVTVKYSDGTQRDFSLNETIVTGLDTSKEQTLDNVIISIGGYSQKVTFNVVSSAKTLKYVAGQGGVIEGDTTQYVIAGYSGTTVVAVPDEGYTFLRWSDGNPNPTRTDTKVSRDMNITATFTKKKYTVVFFYPNGTTASEELVMHNEAATKVPHEDEAEMKKYGYVLAGWSEDYSHITADTNIYPVYRKQAADLYLSFTQSVEGTDLGYAKDLKAYYPNNDVTSTIRIEANPFRHFVSWTIKTYNGSYTIHKDDRQEIQLPIGSPNSYVTFAGGRTGSSDEYTLTFTLIPEVTEFYVTANFEYDSSSITFSTMGSMLNSIELPADTAIGEMFDVRPEEYLNEATREAYLASADCPAYLKTQGYVFKGWYVMGTPVDPMTGYPAFIDNSQKFNMPTALIAYWEKKIYDVVFLKGANQDTSFESLEWFNPKTGQSETYYDAERGGLVLTVLYQDQIGGALTGIFPEATPYRQYYTFAGWYVADDGGIATNVLVDKTYKVTKSINVVPVFTVNQRLADFVISGSGAVVSLSGGLETSIPGTFRMDMTGDYTFRFLPGEGYSLDKIIVYNGLNQVSMDASELFNPETGRYEYSLAAPIQQNYSFQVDFTSSEFDITIKNGTSGLNGGIKYTDEGSFNTALNQSVTVYSGQSRRLWINAPENHRIDAVYVNGVPVEDIGDDAVSYTLVLNNITASVSVEISYAVILFNITVPDNIPGGIVNYDSAESPMGESPSISVIANDGYYIKALKVNGLTIDPYHPGTGMSVVNLESVTSIAEGLRNASGGGADAVNDVRVTYYELVFDSISSDKNISVEFAPIFYYVNVTSQGVGTVGFSKASFSQGSTIYVSAQTTSPYYVHSYSYTTPALDDETQVYDFVMTNTMANVEIQIRDLRRDVEVNVVFMRRSYTIDFNNLNQEGQSGEFAAIQYTDNEQLVSGNLPLTMQMEALTSKAFRISARQGYQIESILVQTEEDVRNTVPGFTPGKYEDVAFNAETHTVTLDNITTGYSVTVVCRVAVHTIRLWLANGQEGDAIDGEEVSYKSYSVEYGQTFSAKIEFNDQLSSFDAQKSIVTGTTDSVILELDSPDEILAEISFVTGNADIIVVLVPIVDNVQPHKVSVRSDSNTGTLTAFKEVDNNGVRTLTGIENGQVMEGDTVVLRFTPASGYKLRYLLINGSVIHIDTGNTYRIESVESDVFAEAIFIENEIPLLLNMHNAFGMLSSPVSYFVYGETVTIRVVAATGYNVYNLSIGSINNPIPLDNEALALFNASGSAKQTDYTIDTNDYSIDDLSAGLYVSVEFAPKVYNLLIELTGLGSIGGDYFAGIEKSVNYGTAVSIPIAANDNNFISSVIVNGISYNPFDLKRATANSAIQKCIGGTLEFIMTGDTEVAISFSPNVYGVTVVPVYGGETLVCTATQNYSDGTGLELLAGENITISMEAMFGYHISELYINGELIRPENWKLDLYTPNNNRRITYEYKGPNSSGITGNVHIKAVYEINMYTIAVMMKNKSLNFRNVNTTPVSFGTVAIKGQSPASTASYIDTDSVLMTVHTYAGITHGSPVYFTFAPVTYDGYKIDLDTAVITYYDSQDTTSSEAKVIALRTEIGERGGVYVLPALTSDIESVYVEFVKEKYTYTINHLYDQKGSAYLPAQTGISITFSNPYLANTDVIVEEFNNKSYYEYGLDFSVNCVPGEGYEVSSFLINGDSKMNSLRNNKYSGRIVSDINVFAEYAITTHKITYTTNLTPAQINQGLGNLAIYTSNNILLWTYGMPASGLTLPLCTPNGTITAITANYIMVTYNAVIKFSAIPNYVGKGYKIDYVSIDGSYQQIVNPDVESFFEYTVKSSIRSQVNFSVHYYNVVVNSFEGGSHTIIGSSSVEWNKDCSIVLNISAGYRLNAILVNGTADAGLLSNARKTTLNDASTQYELTISSIKSHKTLTIVAERIPFDISFDGGFQQSFNVLGDTMSCVTGVVFNQNTETEKAFFSNPSAWTNAQGLTTPTNPNDSKKYVYGQYRYRDSATIYFMPIDGYKVKNVTITMKTVKNVVMTIVNTADSLILYNSRYGYYYYRINEVTGDIAVTVNYEIKTYNVTINVMGLGAISKVELNDNVQSGSTVIIPRTVNHYDILTVDFLANYGYHLQTLTINGRVISDVQYSIITKNVAGIDRKLYSYTTDVGNGARMVIDSQVINGMSNLTITAEFAINTYAVKTFINGLETNHDDTLTLGLSNSSMEFNSNFTIYQQILEGYSITDLTLKNYSGYVISAYNYNNPGHASVLEASQFAFLPTGIYIDYLDYHDTTGNNSVLYVYYSTIINTHTSIINTYLFEYDESGTLISDTKTIPYVTKVTSGGTSQVPAFTLITMYGGRTGFENGAIHNYGTNASFRLFMDPAATDDYVFAGYQVFQNGQWRYVQKGESSLILSSSSVSSTGEKIYDTLDYDIKSNLEFRAVVYRMYDVVVEIHPEYKWQSGILSLTNFNLKYVQYASLAAKQSFDSGMNPNLSVSMLTLSDKDGVNDASYTYRVYCGAKLNLTLTDTKTNVNPVTSTLYYDITGSGVTAVKTLRPYGQTNAVVINSDRLVHAYANNGDKMHLDVALETQGETVGSEGGSVKYYVYSESMGQYVSKSLRDNAVLMAPNSLVKLEITPKTSYRFDGLYRMEAQNNANNGYQVFIPDSWLPMVKAIPGQPLSVSAAATVVSAVSENGVYTILLRLIENTVVKIKFWKQMALSSSVSLLYGNTERTIAPSEATGMLQYLKFTEYAADGVYDYEQDVTFTVPEITETGWELRYRFIGFFVNGVNSFKQLDSDYPDSTSVTYRLYSYDEVERADGVTMVRNSTNEMYRVNIVAKFVMIANITFTNEYYFFDPEQGDLITNRYYFDSGKYTASYVPYDNDLVVYSSDSSDIQSKVTALNIDNTDRSIQIFAKLNGLGSSYEERSSASSAYNTWNDNNISLVWSRNTDENPNAAGFTFIEWQYYSYDGSSWAWRKLPDPITTDQNKPTNVSYVVPVSALLQYSYLLQNTTERMSVTQYKENMEFDCMIEIQTIKIRPLFQRKENITVNKIVYATQEGVIDEASLAASVYGPAYIQENGDTKGTYNFYTKVTIKIGNRDGYKFLGWEYSSGLGSEFIPVDYANAGTPMGTSRHYEIINHGSDYAGDLLVRLVDETVVRAIYIKIWDISIKVFNKSGNTEQILNSAPYLMYYGIRRLQGDEYVYNTEPEKVESRTMSLELRAGQMLKFMLSFEGTAYDATYDKYVGTTMYDSARNALIWSEGVLPPVGASPAVLSTAEFYVKADNQKTIEVVFETLGQLRVENLYPMSSLVLPDSLFLAMANRYATIDAGGNFSGKWSTNAVVDNDGYLDEDNTPGVILITGIPIVKLQESTYDGIFKNKLPSMGGNHAFFNPYISSFDINFSGFTVGTGKYQKYQAFKYFNIYNDSGVLLSSGVSQLDMPFATNGVNSGIGTQARPFSIKTLNQFKAIETFIISNGYTANGIHFQLDADIVATGLYSGGASGICGTYPFDGILHGNGKTVTFSNIDTTVSEFGLFRKTDNNAQIYDIKIGNSSTISISAGNAVGAGYLVGIAKNTLIDGVTTLPGQITIIGSSCVGFVVGRATGTTVINNAVVTNAVIVQAISSSNGRAGGIVGEIKDSAKVSNSRTTNVNLYCFVYSGGIAGYTEGNNAYAIDTCTVASVSFTSQTGSYGLGRIVGYNGANRTVYNCDQNGPASITISSRNMDGVFGASSPDYYKESSGKVVYGAGLVAGINEGTLAYCDISNMTSVTMTGSFCGAIAGVNTGTIDNCKNTNVYVSMVKTEQSKGGVYGGIAGLNAGTISNCQISSGGSAEYNFNNATFAIKATTYQDAFIPQRTGSRYTTAVDDQYRPTKFTAATDSAFLYVGGVTGYNSSYGNAMIIGCTLTYVKIVVNRWTDDNNANSTYAGMMIGYNNSSKYSSSNSITNSSVVFFHAVIVEAFSSDKQTDNTHLTVSHYLGATTGGGSLTTITGTYMSGNTILRRVAGLGTYFSTYARPPALLQSGKNASGYSSGNISSYTNGGTGVTVYGLDKIPNNATSDNDYCNTSNFEKVQEFSFWPRSSSYQYNGCFRNLVVR